MRIPIPDRPGAAAEIFTLAAREGINIASFEVVHLAESNLGVAVVLVDADAAEAYRAALAAEGCTRRCRRSREAPACRRRPGARRGDGARLEEHRQPGARRRRPCRRRQHVDERARRRRHHGDAALSRRPRRRRRSRSTTARCSSPAPAGGCSRAPSSSTPGSPGTTSRFVTALAALADQPVDDRRRPSAAHPADGRAARRARRPRRRDRATARRAGRLPVTVTGPLRRWRHVCACAATCPASSSRP